MDPDVSAYVGSLEEVSWGIVLIATTMAMHGLGVILTLRAGIAMRRLRPSGANGSESS